MRDKWAGAHYIYGDYNPFFPYGPSWWLYAIPIEDLTDDKQMEEWQQATWLNSEWRLEALFKGVDLPDEKSFRNPHTPNFRADPSDYCRAFFRKYPAGVVCEIKGDGRQFIKQESDNLGDYLRIVRERQLKHIAKAQEEEH